MKGLLLGNNFESLFNDQVNTQQIKLKILNAIDNYDNNKIEHFLDKFFSHVSYFAEKEGLLRKSSYQIFKKLVAPSLLEIDDQNSIDAYTNQISYNVDNFLNSYKIGLGPNVIEAFLKSLILYYLKEQWFNNTSKKLNSFLANKDVKNYFNQFDVILTTSYAPILDLINQNLQIELSPNNLINLYGNFNSIQLNDFEHCHVLWNGRRQNCLDMKKTLNSLNLDNLEVIELDLSSDQKLWNEIISLLKFNQMTPSKINYLSNNLNYFDNFYRFLKHHQINEVNEIKKYQDFKNQEKNLGLTVVKSDKQEVNNYAYEILYDDYLDHHLTLTRKRATIIKTEFYYNLSKFFQDGYSIEKENFLLKTENEYDSKEDLIISFLELKNNFGNIYNKVFKTLLNFDEEISDLEIESTKNDLILVREVKPKKWNFWKWLFRIKD